MSNEEMKEVPAVDVTEDVVLRKYEGEPLPENEFERLVVKDGLVVEHSQIQDGEVVGPVVEGNLSGIEIGKFTQPQ